MTESGTEDFRGCPLWVGFLRPTHRGVPTPDPRPLEKTAGRSIGEILGSRPPTPDPRPSRTRAKIDPRAAARSGRTAHGGLARSDRAAAMLVSAAANPLSGRLLKPSESKMEGDIQVRFYRDCIYTSYILQADRRMVPPPATDSACKQDGRVVQMRFYRVCGHASHILQLEERPRSVSARRGARGTVNRGAAAPIHRPGNNRGHNPKSR